MRMKFEGQTVAIVGGTVRVKFPNGDQQIVPWDQLDSIQGMSDRGKADEGDQWVKVTLEHSNKTLGVEANGVWPSDVATFLLDALKVIVKEQKLATTE